LGVALRIVHSMHELDLDALRRDFGKQRSPPRSGGAVEQQRPQPPCRRSRPDQLATIPKWDRILARVIDSGQIALSVIPDVEPRQNSAVRVRGKVPMITLAQRFAVEDDR